MMRFTLYADRDDNTGFGKDFETTDGAIAAARDVAGTGDYVRVWVREYDGSDANPKTIWECPSS